MTSFMNTSYRWLLTLFAIGLVACGETRPERPELLVFAAASLRDVAADFATEFESRYSARVVYNFAGSNTLAQQIRAAPGADVFLSADETWVDFLEQAQRTVAGTRRAFLSNRLVLISQRDVELGIEHPRDLADAISSNGGKLSFLALADPQAVPAGRYARAALERLEIADGSLWTALDGKIAPTLDVRAALALVESDPAIAGIVYLTDTMTSDKVRVLYEFPASEEVPIRYAAVQIAAGEEPELGRLFLDFLTSGAASKIARRNGFSPAPGRTHQDAAARP